MLMTNDLSIELREYLTRCGLPQTKIAQCNASTRMYHDLGLYGDIAQAYMEVLADHYHVDLSGFEFQTFFPEEFEGKTLLTRVLFSLIPFASHMARRRGEWLPLTLERVDRAILSKRWE